MPRYLLLAYEADDAFGDLAPEEAQAVLQRYLAWSQGLRDSGHLIHSNKLQDGTGRAVRRDATGSLVVRDGPYAETKEVIGGFWLVEAEDWDAAVELASGCPHVDFAPLVIRAIDEV